MQKIEKLKSNLNFPVFSIIGKAADKLHLETYVIGGYVRDQFLNRATKDIDIVVIGSGIALAEYIAEYYPNTSDIHVYKTFGTAQLIIDGIEVEFVGARKESYNFESRKPTVENGTLEDDQNRRDFTINAMAFSLNATTFGQLLDPFNGLDDIAQKIIRTPLNPNITFSDDPLRMMRAVRFASQLNFKIDNECFKAIQRNSERLKIISKERIIAEFNKILTGKTPSYGIHLLSECGLLAEFLPQLLLLKGIEKQNGLGHKDNFLHTLEVVDKIALNTSNLWLIWAALLHDIGKPLSKRFDPQNGWSFHQHEYIGYKMIPKIFNELKMPMNDKMHYVQKLVGLHLRPQALVEDCITDSAIRRLLFDAGDDINDLMLLCEADVTSKNPKKLKECFDNFTLVRKKLKEIEEKDEIRNWQPPIDGELIMKTFNISPSSAVGIIKKAIREAILDGKIDNNYNDAYQFMIIEGQKLGLTPTHLQKDN